MSEIQRLIIQDGQESYEVYVEMRSDTSLPELKDDAGERPGAKGIGVNKDVLVQLEKAHQVIRGYTLYALGAFKNFTAAEIEEITLKFGLKFSGQSGIPYIAQGSAETSLEVEVKCKLPDKKQSSN
jgi:hypothetical protein